MTSSEKRQRHKEGHRSRVEQARIAAAQAQRRNRILRILVGVLVIVLGLAVVAFLVRDDASDDESADDATTTAPDDATTTEPVPSMVLPPGPEGATLEGETPCPAEDGSEERVAVFAQAPPTCVEEGQALVAEIAVDQVDDAGEATPAGTIVVELDAEAAPQAVNNFVVLSRYQFYDGIPFHRLVPDFVAQVGGSGAPGADGAPDYGTTGPGYDLEDVEHPEDGYAVGDVAMARAETVSGSQFFIVTSESALQALDQAGTYPRFGRVTEGLELAAEMASQGDPATNGTPLALYVISDVTIRPA